MNVENSFKVFYYTLSLYGLCRFTMPPLSGVVRKTLSYIPASYIIGSVVNSYMMYLCNNNMHCLCDKKTFDACSNDCLIKSIFEGMRKNKISLFHAIPENVEKDIRKYFLFWERVNEYILRKHVLPHLALNRVTGNVYTEFENDDKRGYLYGDEIFTGYRNSFFGFIVASDEYADEIVELLRYVSIGRIGHRSKYCFPEINITSPIELSFEFMDDRELVAPCGLAFTKMDTGFRIRRASINVLDINRISVKNIYGRECNTIYKLLNVETSKIIFAEPMAELLISGKSDLKELMLFGIKNNPLSSLGWNKLVPLSFMRRYR